MGLDLMQEIITGAGVQSLTIWAKTGMCYLGDL